MPFELMFDEISEPQQEESFLQSTGRNLGRTGLRVAEQAAGFPGDVLSLVNDYIASPLSSEITGQEGIPYEELGISKILPTSGQLRKGHEKQLGENINPKNNLEQFSDNLFSTATSIFTPGAAIKAGNFTKTALSSLVKSLGANLAKDAVKDFTGDEQKGAIAELGSLLLLSYIDKKGAAKAISEGYKPLEKKASQLLPVSANKLENNLSNLKSKMQKGTQAPSEKFIIDEVDAVVSKIKNGTITPEEAWASKRSLNEKLSKVLYDTPYKSQPRARKLASVISQELDDTLLLTKKQDPTFYKELKGWNNAYKAMADSNIASKWVAKNIKYTPLTNGLLNMLGGPVGQTAAVATLPYQLLKVGYRMAKSKKLAKHYAKATAAVAAEDAVTFNKELKILDQEMQKDQKKDRWELID